MPAPALPYGAISLSCSKKASGRVWTMAPRAVGAFAPRMRKAFRQRREDPRWSWRKQALPETEKARARAPDPRQKGAASDQSGVRFPKSAHLLGVTESTDAPLEGLTLEALTLDLGSASGHLKKGNWQIPSKSGSRFPHLSRTKPGRGVVTPMQWKRVKSEARCFARRSCGIPQHLRTRRRPLRECRRLMSRQQPPTPSPFRLSRPLRRAARSWTCSPARSSPACTASGKRRPAITAGICPFPAVSRIPGASRQSPCRGRLRASFPQKARPGAPSLVICGSAMADKISHDEFYAIGGRSRSALKDGGGWE